jgi:hypothetical protein
MAKQKNKNILRNLIDALKKIFNAIFATRLGYSIFSLLVIVIGSIFAIRYARGSWRLTKEGMVANTGLLNVNSFPTGAQVFINDRLITATDDTVYIDPGEYQIKIVKEGYSIWQKNLVVQEELVTQTNATLFPTAPSLSPLTFTGVSNIHPSPDGQKILFHVSQANTVASNGFYPLELTSNFLSLQSGLRQITDDIPALELDKAHIIWSPDSQEVMILVDQKFGGREFLIPIDKKNALAEQVDISFSRSKTLSAWEEEIYQKERLFLEKFPEEILQIATQSAKNVYISPDKKRLLYTATADVTLPEELIPPLPATNNQVEERDLKTGNIYVYDREEDKNFLVLNEEIRPNFPLHNLGVESANLNRVESVNLNSEENAQNLDRTTSAENNNQQVELGFLNKQLLSDDLFASEARQLEASPEAFLRLQADSADDKETTAINFSNYYTGVKLNSLQWFPDSKHLLYVADGKVQIMEYDGHNNTVIYSGPFIDEFVYPWPDGSQIIIYTSFSPDSPFNLYAINLK